ncbi:MAG: hypothetical protein HQL72_15745 [Magnetococcales bacterium]|nr:hypothetical protein [Magnetococcales bacterium]
MVNLDGLVKINLADGEQEAVTGAKTRSFRLLSAANVIKAANFSKDGGGFVRRWPVTELVTGLAIARVAGELNLNVKLLMTMLTIGLNRSSTNITFPESALRKVSVANANERDIFVTIINGKFMTMESKTVPNHFIPLDGEKWRPIGMIPNNRSSKNFTPVLLEIGESSNPVLPEKWKIFEQVQKNPLSVHSVNLNLSYRIAAETILEGLENLPNQESIA